MATGPCGVAMSNVLACRHSLAQYLAGECSGSSSTGGFISSPIIAGDSLYIGDTKGRLYRLHGAMAMSSGNSRNWGR
jgi:hypothetical protein